MTKAKKIGAKFVTDICDASHVITLSTKEDVLRGLGMKYIPFSDKRPRVRFCHPDWLLKIFRSGKVPDI